jgi:hypothetical protein
VTDEERKKLCDKLRLPGITERTAIRANDCRVAADEIERLAKENKRLKHEAGTRNKGPRDIGVAE